MLEFVCGVFVLILVGILVGLSIELLVLLLMAIGEVFYNIREDWRNHNGRN